MAPLADIAGFPADSCVFLESSAIGAAAFRAVLRNRIGHSLLVGEWSHFASAPAKSGGPNVSSSV
ncbi:MAG: hypothetical protein QY320_11785 [Gammaproteobacteria bacterium]|nr:MAG: hypothetical protein QY320_11785 [Gammaproteobacteria bacterium]